VPGYGAMSILGKRLVVVTGKGGVGKSTVTAALGVTAAERGLRTVLVEVAGRADIREQFGDHGDEQPEPELAPRLHHVSVEPRGALEQYLRDEAPGRLIASVLARSRVFDALITATPGMAELLTIGKVWELAQRPRHKPGARIYDLVILDAPASGHAGALLGAPASFGSMAGGGPMAHQSAAIARTLRDPRSTGVIAVSTAEQMAVSETLSLREAFAEKLGIAIDAVVVNRLLSSPFTANEARAIEAAGEDPAVRSAHWLHARATNQRELLVRLERNLNGVPLTTLPFVFAGIAERAELDRLAARLGRYLP
jgi:anion-transporting  ArsA/GET3 family ATPase